MREGRERYCFFGLYNCSIFKSDSIQFKLLSMHFTCDIEIESLNVRVG